VMAAAAQQMPAQRPQLAADSTPLPLPGWGEHCARICSAIDAALRLEVGSSGGLANPTLTCFILRMVCATLGHDAGMSKGPLTRQTLLCLQRLIRWCSSCSLWGWCSTPWRSLAPATIHAAATCCALLKQRQCLQAAATGAAAAALPATAARRARSSIGSSASLCAKPSKLQQCATPPEPHGCLQSS
jgi:hypothetical protein